MQLRTKPCLHLIYLLPAVFVAGTGARRPTFQSQLHPDLAVAIRLVDEAWHVLDFASSEAWPGWSTYRDEVYFTAIPGLQDIMINPPGDPGAGYVRLQETVQGSPLYLRDPSPIERVRGGSYRFRLAGRGMKAVYFYPPSPEHAERWIGDIQRYFAPDPPPSSAVSILRSREYLVSTIVHEAFHHYQESAFERTKLLNKTHPSPFDGDERQASLAMLEGRVLSRAMSVTDRDSLIELSREFLAVRAERRRSLTPEDVAWEKRNELVEGTAMYAETRVLQILADRQYRPKVLEPGEPHFHEFAIAADMVRLNMLWIQQSPRLRGNEVEAGFRHYYFGMAQGTILDRLVGPGWKLRIVEPEVYVEGLVEEACGFDPSRGSVFLGNAKRAFR